MAFTVNDLEKLKKLGKIKSFTELKPQKSVIPPDDLKHLGKGNKHWMLIHLQAFAVANNLILSTEYKFHPTRRYKFDFALHNVERTIKIGIEYEGIFSRDGHQNGHTSMKGYTDNTEKYNLCQAARYQLLRYTAKNYQSIFDDLNKIINAIQS